VWCCFFGAVASAIRTFRIHARHSPDTGAARTGRFSGAGTGDNNAARTSRRGTPRHTELDSQRAHDRTSISGHRFRLRPVAVVAQPATLGCVRLVAVMFSESIG
jgi:hypothetical protein